MRSLFSIGILLLAISCSAQTEGKIKLYGYVQSVAGNRDLELSEDGQTKERIGAGKNYLLYAVSPNRIYPAEIWIEGVRYGVTVKSISKTPVIYRDETNIGSPEQTLIPATKEKLVQLIPIPQLTKPVGERAKTLATQHAVVLVYKQAGKFHYNTLKNLTELSVAALQ